MPVRTLPLCTSYLFGTLDDKLKRYDPLYIAPDGVAQPAGLRRTGDAGRSILDSTPNLAPSQPPDAI
ncbi:MAG: hypothetical protein V9G98_12895 [Candidatus Competibacter sp.]